MHDTKRRALLGVLIGAIPGSALLIRCASQNRPTPGVVTLATFDTDEAFDVCIAGSGPAGLVLACELARQGVRTLVLEAGGTSDDAYKRIPVGFDRSGSGLTSAYAYPVDSARYIATGGTSHIWSGFSPRFRPGDFDAHPYSRGEGWPIPFSELEKHYARAERELRVQSPSPKALTELRDMAALLGPAGFPIEPTPLSEVDGEPLNVAQTHLPDFTKSLRGTLVTDARVTKVLSEEGGAVTSLEVHNAAGLKKLVRARIYVLATGGIETPRLLLLSWTPEFPTGLGNRSDQVGRNFMEHLQVGADGMAAGVARRDDSDEPYVEAISWQANEEFKAKGLGGIVLEFAAPKAKLDILRLSPILEMEPSSSNRVVLDESRRDSFGNPTASLTMRLSDRDVATIRQAESLMQSLITRLGMGPAQRNSWTALLHHHIGTCRMSSDPRAGVVDPHLKVHGLDNLYVAGSAPFVTSSGAPPTLTIVALSLRLAEHLAARLRGVRHVGQPGAIAGVHPVVVC
jgi:choline dehydrogenase-like flavoprotein